MDCRPGSDYQGGFGDMAHSGAGGKKADSHCPGGAYQLDRIAVLLLLRQAPYDTVAGCWSQKILMAA